MNVDLPLPMEKHAWPFWVITFFAFASAGFVFWLWRVKKW